MVSLEDVNELAKVYPEWHIMTFNGSRLVVVGSFDLSYYHDVELHFIEVASINCPVWFCCPEFHDAGPVDDGRRFVIRADEGEFAILANAIEVVVGKVFYYDRGEQLQPGERIADWVKRSSG